MPFSIVTSDLKSFQFNCEEDVEEEDKVYEKAKFLEVRRFPTESNLTVDGPLISDREVAPGVATMRQTEAQFRCGLFVFDFSFLPLFER